jgi:hypothetical protein
MAAGRKREAYRDIISDIETLDPSFISADLSR